MLAAASVPLSRSFALSRRKAPRVVRACIALGDKIPDGVFTYFDADSAMHEVSVESLFKGKKVVLCAVPGAFLPTCSMKHLPGFINSADELRAQGVDVVACVAVNDAFVMDAWGKSLGADDKRVLMLADGNARFTESMGAALDLRNRGIGVRSRRYSLMAEDMIVTVLHLEEGGAFTVSGADQLLADIKCPEVSGDQFV